MKQCISKQQWNELSAKKKRVFITSDGSTVYCNVIKDHEQDWDFQYPNIGDMIEFLGEDLEGIKFIKPTYNVSTLLPAGFGSCQLELADALWEACKYKVKS